MASLSAAAPRGVSTGSLDALLALGVGDAERRRAALARYEALPAPAPSGRDWRHDLRKLDLSQITFSRDDGGQSPAVQVARNRFGETGAVATQDAGTVTIAITDELRARGVVVCDFGTARRDHVSRFEQTLGTTVGARDKYAALTEAFHANGIFVHVPDGIAVGHPIAIVHAASQADAFPYTLVSAGAGTRISIVEYATVTAGDRFVCGLTEIVAADGADVTYSVLQENDSTARTIMTRRARVGAGAKVAWAVAELGSALCVDGIVTRLDGVGSRCETTALFYATGDQHVDLATEVAHDVPSTTSDTVVKSAASDRGQARYLGNIKIAPHAHGTEAALRDDTLLLSARSHIDSVPALEIAANDVKAFHGATVGALDEEHIFYIMSRGIDRVAAEQLVALGFFEPAVARFPTERLRDDLRTALNAKVTASVTAKAAARA